MRFRLFLVCAIALATAVFSSIDLSAGCRCQRGSRREARQDRRAARRDRGRCDSVSAQYVQGYQYPEQVQDLGGQPQVSNAAVEYEVVWQCTGAGCRPVRVPVARPKPVPDPKFVPKPATVPITKVEETKPATSVSPADYETVPAVAPTQVIELDPEQVPPELP